MAALRDTPDWYARWAIRHAERWGLRRYNDPQLMADWWALFRHAHVAEAELDEASLWLVTADKPPRGRPDHPRMLLNRIKSQRQTQAARPAPASSPTDSETLEKALHELREGRKKIRV